MERLRNRSWLVGPARHLPRQRQLATSTKPRVRGVNAEELLRPCARWGIPRGTRRALRETEHGSGVRPACPTVVEMACVIAPVRDGAGERIGRQLGPPRRYPPGVLSPLSAKSHGLSRPEPLRPTLSCAMPGGGSEVKRSLSGRGAPRRPQAAAVSRPCWSVSTPVSRRTMSGPQATAGKGGTPVPRHRRLARGRDEPPSTDYLRPHRGGSWQSVHNAPAHERQRGEFPQRAFLGWTSLLRAALGP